MNSLHQILFVNLLLIGFLSSLAVPNKQFFSVKLLAGLRGQLFNSSTINKFKIKLLCIEEKLFCTKMELLNFKFTPPLAKLEMAGSKLVSNGLIFSDDIPVNLWLVTFLLLSLIKELSIGAKTKKFSQPLLPVKNIRPNKKSYLFSDICATLFVKSAFFSASKCFILFEVNFFI